MNIKQRTYLYIWMHKHRYVFCMCVSICLTNVCCFSESLYLRRLLSLHGRSKRARQDMPPEMVGLKTVLVPQKAVPWLDMQLWCFWSQLSASVSIFSSGSSWMKLGALRILWWDSNRNPAHRPNSWGSRWRDRLPLENPGPEPCQYQFLGHES